MGWDVIGWDGGGWGGEVLLISSKHRNVPLFYPTLPYPILSSLCLLVPLGWLTLIRTHTVAARVLFYSILFTLLLHNIFWYRLVLFNGFSCRPDCTAQTADSRTHTDQVIFQWIRGQSTYTRTHVRTYLPLSAPNLDILSSILVSTIFLMSLCSLLPKSLNIVVPPESTMFLYSPLLTSIGHFTMASSTTSGKGVRKSEEKISGLKNTSGPRNRSYPTSQRYGRPVLF